MTRRCFLALALPEEVGFKLSALQHLLRLEGAVPPESFHLTLSFLGDLRDETLESVHDALSALRLPAFDLTLYSTGIFGKAKPHAFWVGVADNPALLHCQSKVETAARRAGAVIPAQKFIPHVTLARFRSMMPEDRMILERLTLETAQFQLVAFPVTAISLYQSFPGPRYDALMDYPLIPR